MSWITDLAGKAENILNQIDHGAGQAIDKVKEQKQQQSSRRPSHSNETSSSSAMGGSSTWTHDDTEQLLSVMSSDPVPSGRQPATPGREHVRVNMLSGKKFTGLPFSSSGYASSLASSQPPAPKTPSDARDADLFAYLNEQPKAGTSIGSRSRRSSASSMHSLPAHLVALAKSAVGVDATPASAAVSETTGGEYTMSTAAERRASEMQARQTDLAKAVQAKDAQLAVLRVELQEAQQALSSRSHKLEQLAQERDRLLRDSSDSSKTRNQALDALTQQLDDANAAAEKDRTRAAREQTELLAKTERLEDDILNLNKQLSDLQKSSTDDKVKCKEMDSQLRLAKYNLEANKNEFDEYKQKAQKILQSKERIIESLKGTGSSGLSGTDGEQTGQLGVQLEEVTAERDLLKEDLQQLHVQMQNCRSELQEVESQMAGEQRQWLEQQRRLQEQCQQYQMNAGQFREQLEQLKAEYQYVQDELRRQHLEFQQKLHQKDTEIERLVSQQSARTSVGRQADAAAELEGRVRSLTEQLIYKQTTVETLQTERNGLALQLERVNAQYEEAQAAAIRAIGLGGAAGGKEHTQLYMGADDNGHGGLSASSRVPAVLRPSPYDSSLAAAVKSGYGQLDLFCAKVAATFRRYPFARVLMLAYMLLLHTWVMVVLLTYTPEIHTSLEHAVAVGLGTGHTGAGAVGPGAQPILPSGHK